MRNTIAHAWVIIIHPCVIRVDCESHMIRVYCIFVFMRFVIKYVDVIILIAMAVVDLDEGLKLLFG